MLHVCSNDAAIEDTMPAGSIPTALHDVAATLCTIERQGAVQSL
jgi:hypothetical protein